jgi:hypothetical protein
MAVITKSASIRDSILLVVTSTLRGELSAFWRVETSLYLGLDKSARNAWKNKSSATIKHPPI